MFGRAEIQRLFDRPAVRWSTVTVLATVAYYAVAQVGHALSVAGTDQPTFWPAAGLAAGVMVAIPRRCRWLIVGGTILASLAAGATSGLDPIVAFGFALADGLEPFLFALLIDRIPDRLSRPASVRTTAFYAGAAFVAAASGGLLAAGASLIDTRAPAGLVLSWWRATAAGTVGIVLLAAAVNGAIARLRSGERRLVRNGWQRRTVPALVTIATTVLVFTMPVLSEIDAVGFVVLPLLAWTATVSGRRSTTAVSMIVGVGSIAMTALGQGPFALEDPLTAVLSVQAFVVVTHLTAMALSIESESRRLAVAEFEGVIDSTTDAVVVVDDEDIIRSANEAASQLFGKPNAELVGAAFSSFFRGRIPRHGGAEVVVDEETTVQVEVTAREVIIGHGRLHTYVLHDLTQSRATQDALTRAFEIIDATPELVAWFDPGGRLQFINGAGRSMLKLENSDLDGFEHADLSPARSSVLLDGIAHAVGNDAWQGEVELRRQDGTLVPVDVTVIAHRDLEGRVSATSLVGRDLTDRLELDRLKDEFVANLTHELRTPLTAITGYIELFADGAFGALDEDAAMAIDSMSETSSQLLELINDLLTLWRSERDTSDEWRRFEVGDVVAGVVGTMQTQAHRKGVVLSHSGDEIWAVGNRSNVQRAIMNLVSNAVKFTGAGGMVTVVCERRDGMVRVSVADSGIGIAASEQEHVFDRFYRATSAESASIPGTGLGLPIVREIARAHGGDVTLQSVLNHGTFVVFEIPAADDAHLSDEVPSGPQALEEPEPLEEEPAAVA